MKQKDNMATEHEKELFIGYVRSFYFDDDALYPMMHLTRDLVDDLKLITDLLSLDESFEGDSWDREKARDVLIGLGYGIKWGKDDKEYTYRKL